MNSDAFRFPTPGQVGILVIQGFAIVVAFSTLLGRVYLQDFLHTLRIPASDYRISAVDYAVVSPDLTVASVGMALIFGCYLLGLVWSKGNKGKERWRILTGIALIVLGIVGLLATLFLRTVPHIPFGGWGVPWTASFASFAFGLASLFSYEFGNVAIEQNSGDGKTNENRSSWEFLKLLFPILLVIVPLAMVGSAFDLASQAGEHDANKHIESSPYALLDFLPLVAANSQGCYGGASEPNLSSVFRVIMVGDEFVYLRSDIRFCGPLSGIEFPPGEPYQYAVPVEHIKGITYIEKPQSPQLNPSESR